MKKTRESGIELLRILLMIGVIILHINNADIGGALKYVDNNSVNYIVLLILENIFVCAVDIFVIITGYFYVKVIKGLLQKFWNYY